MKLDSVRAFKDEVSDEVVKAAGDTPEAFSFFAASEPPMPSDLALGVARAGDEHLVAVRTSDPALAEKIKARVNGEADVRIVTVAKRSTPGYLQGVVRPLESGAQVGMASKNFVGTLGCFVRDAAGTLYALSNSHVLADEGRAAPGHRIGQPFGSPSTALVGLLDRFVPFSTTVPNRVDCALMRLDKTKALLGFNGALGGNMLGERELHPDDLGRDVLKVGRTTGARAGKITAIEIDGLSVAYDQGVLRFNDQFEVSGGPATDFSAAGDSGSVIVDRNGYAVGLLFAGGRDATGEDMTYANRMTLVLSALGVTLA